jgi:hypothetical protein
MRSERTRGGGRVCRSGVEDQEGKRSRRLIGTRGELGRLEDEQSVSRAARIDKCWGGWIYLCEAAQG